MSLIGKILNVGFDKGNNHHLNRKIRINNLISLLSVVIISGFMPSAIYFDMQGIIILNVFFILSSLLCYYLNTKKHYNASFYISAGYGLLYFICGPVFFGLDSNLHFFILMMCLIAIALFENNLVLKVYIGVAVLSFFGLLMYMHNRPALIHFTPEIMRSQHIVSVLNLLFLFFITILFFIFFRRENLLFQKEVLLQKAVIEEKQKEILDSINYAKRIQFSLLTGDSILQQHLPEHFILFNPKDVVSGDFYWATPVSDGFLYITADCTGHGVPGAFMSLLNISKLSQVINENKVTRPDMVFNQVRTEIIQALNAGEQGGESKDGMDAVLCKIDLKNRKLEYAAANNSFFIVRDQALITCKADKMPVGKGHDDSLSFTYKQLDLQKGDVIYTFTDGYADQFGGPKGKKFKCKKLGETLLSIHHHPMAEQKAMLEKTFQDWKGDLDQVDDVCIIGVRIS